MMQGYSLSAHLPEDSGLGERFWYWRGASGQSYIHSIYAADHCPPVPGAVFVVVRRQAGQRHAVVAGCFGTDGLMPPPFKPLAADEEIHVHLLARDVEGAKRVLADLLATLEDGPALRVEPRGVSKPVQLEFLLAA